jgi:hypothetical protein
MVGKDAMKLLLCIFLITVSTFAFAEETLLDEVIGNSEPTTEDDFNEEEFLDTYSGPITEILFDQRSESEYIRVIIPNVSISERHYLADLTYFKLILALTDMLNRITNEGYIYSSDILTTYEKNEEIAIVYFEDIITNTASGEVRFPEVTMKVVGGKTPSPLHYYDISNATNLSTLILRFVMSLSEIERTLGYSMRRLLKPE